MPPNAGATPADPFFVTVSGCKRDLYILQLPRTAGNVEYPREFGRRSVLIARIDLPGRYVIGTSLLLWSGLSVHRTGDAESHFKAFVRYSDRRLQFSEAICLINKAQIATEVSGIFGNIVRGVLELNTLNDVVDVSGTIWHQFTDGVL